MLIFHRFSSTDKAKEFANQVRREHNLNTVVCSSQEESDEHDIFPFQLTPPIVLVHRASEELEHEIEQLVERFDGEFAGT